MGRHNMWIGSDDPLDASGTGVFVVGDVEHALRLDSFSDYMIIDNMLSVASHYGQQNLVNNMRTQIGRAMDMVECQVPYSAKLGK